MTDGEKLSMKTLFVLNDSPYGTEHTSERAVWAETCVITSSAARKQDPSRPWKECQGPRTVEPLEPGPIGKRPMVGGLHHRYYRRAA